MPHARAPQPRKRPIQTRSQATVDAILEAAARILVRDGYGTFTTNRVAAAAGVSVGSLYQYFPNKEALLAELKARHVAQIERGLDAALERVGEAPIAEAVPALVEAMAAAHLIEPDLHRVLSAEVPHLGASDAAEAFERRTFARLRQLLANRRDEVTVDDLDLAAYLLIRTVEGTVHEAVVERPADLASGAISREVTRLVLGYLTSARVVSSRERSTPRRPTVRTARRPGTASPTPPRS